MKKKNMLELNRLDIEQYHSINKIPLVVVLDDIRSLNNIGSIFRTSDAFLVDKIYLCGITATPPSPDIHKTALGAENSVEWKYCKDIMILVESLKREGYTVCSIEQVNGSIDIRDFIIDNEKKYAVVLGNEVKGVKQEVVDKSDFCIELPQFGTKHSLNVSITAGIVIWNFFNSLYN
ncbi:MAG: RNA methyltransferase [Bacteroidetes bacterium]|uniref:RNA methyltransferase n=1 Tax=Candidatus Limisoma faecipullorum TaxID=2840854 RepID=A0A9D9ISA4_9BACT|nr:RNA methyltransferase [Candidatus Limisoma faecipullorum]